MRLNRAWTVPLSDAISDTKVFAEEMVALVSWRNAHNKTVPGGPASLHTFQVHITYFPEQMSKKRSLFKRWYHIASSQCSDKWYQQFQVMDVEILPVSDTSAQEIMLTRSTVPHPTSGLWLFTAQKIVAERF